MRRNKKDVLLKVITAKTPTIYHMQSWRSAHFAKAAQVEVCWINPFIKAELLCCLFVVYGAVLNSSELSSTAWYLIILDGKCQQLIAPFNKLAKDWRFFVSQGAKTTSICAVVCEIAVQPKWNVVNCVFSFIYTRFSTPHNCEHSETSVTSMHAWHYNNLPTALHQKHHNDNLTTMGWPQFPLNYIE